MIISLGVNDEPKVWGIQIRHFWTRAFKDDKPKIGVCMAYL